MKERTRRKHWAAQLYAALESLLGARVADATFEQSRRLRRRLSGPPMVGDTAFELSFGTWFGVFSCFDEEQRYLGEEHGLPPQMRELPDTEWKTWVAPGSRQGRRYNLTALRQIARAWPQVLSDIDVLNKVYVDRFQRAGAGVDLYYLSRISTSIPAFLYRRTDVPIRDATLPVRCAALFKVMAGVGSSVEYLLNEANEHLAEPTMSYAWFVDYVEREGLFVANSGNVCSGSAKLVSELVDHSANPREPARLAQEELEALIGPLGPIVEYGVVNAQIDLAIQIHCWASVLLLHQAWVRAQTCGESTLADVLEEALPDEVEPTRIRAAIAIGRRFFDHAANGSETLSSAAFAEPSVDRAVDYGPRLRGRGLSDDTLIRTVGEFRSLQVRALAGFHELLTQAHRALGRPAPPVSCRMAAMRRPLTFLDRIDVAPIFQVLGLQLGEDVPELRKAP